MMESALLWNLSNKQPSTCFSWAEK